jgi:hypothetical protein
LPQGGLSQRVSRPQQGLEWPQLIAVGPCPFMTNPVPGEIIRRTSPWQVGQVESGSSRTDWSCSKSPQDAQR